MKGGIPEPTLPPGLHPNCAGLPAWALWLLPLQIQTSLMKLNIQQFQQTWFQSDLCRLTRLASALVRACLRLEGDPGPQFQGSGNRDTHASIPFGAPGGDRVLMGGWGMQLWQQTPFQQQDGKTPVHTPG